MQGTNELLAVLKMGKCPQPTSHTPTPHSPVAHVHTYSTTDLHLWPSQPAWPLYDIRTHAPCRPSHAAQSSRSSFLTAARTHTSLPHQQHIALHFHHMLQIDGWGRLGIQHSSLFLKQIPWGCWGRLCKRASSNCSHPRQRPCPRFGQHVLCSAPGLRKPRRGGAARRLAARGLVWLCRTGILFGLMPAAEQVNPWAGGLLRQPRWATCSGALLCLPCWD